MREDKFLIFFLKNSSKEKLYISIELNFSKNIPIYKQFSRIKLSKVILNYLIWKFKSKMLNK